VGLKKAYREIAKSHLSLLRSSKELSKEPIFSQRESSQKFSERRKSSSHCTACISKEYGVNLFNVEKESNIAVGVLRPKIMSLLGQRATAVFEREIPMEQKTRSSAKFFKKQLERKLQAERNIERLRSELDAQEIAPCTFRPNLISQRQKSKSKRTKKPRKVKKMK